MKKIAPALLLFFFSNTSCKRATENPPVTKENIVGTWQLTAKRMSATGIPEQDAFTTLNECEKDDLYRFNIDDSFSYIDSGVTCETNGTSTGVWQLNGEVIAFMGQSGKITNFNGSSMHITVTVTDTSSQTTYTIKWKFKKL